MDGMCSKIVYNLLHIQHWQAKRCKSASICRQVRASRPAVWTGIMVQCGQASWKQLVAQVIAEYLQGTVISTACSHAPVSFFFRNRYGPVGDSELCHLQRDSRRLFEVVLHMGRFTVHMKVKRMSKKQHISQCFQFLNQTSDSYNEILCCCIVLRHHCDVDTSVWQEGGQISCVGGLALHLWRAKSQALIQYGNVLNQSVYRLWVVLAVL